MSQSVAERSDDMVIIDDDELTLEFAKRSLRTTDVKLRCFSDAQSALAHLQHHAPQVLLIDYRMPRLDGLEFLQSLAASSTVAATSVYLCSSTGLPDDVHVKAAALGARPLLKDALRGKADFLALLATAAGSR